MTKENRPATTTRLTPDRLVLLVAEGYLEATQSPFVNPRTASRVKDVLRERGEQWAQSVLSKDLSRRSMYFPQFPWLETGDMEALVLADRAEREL